MINAVTAVTVAALVLASAAAARSSIAPGQRIANYISRHTTRPERRSFQGVELAGGHSQVVNGEVVARGVTLGVLTRLPNTTKGWIEARDFCIAAMQALAQQPRVARSVDRLWVLGRKVAPDATGAGGGRRVLAVRMVYRGHSYCVRDGRSWVTS